MQTVSWRTFFIGGENSQAQHFTANQLDVIIYFVFRGLIKNGGLPPMASYKLLRERTTLRTWLTAIVVTALGILMLFLAEFKVLWASNQSIQSILRDIGSLLIASVAISLLWELVGKRAFLDELLPKVRLSEDILSAGIIGFKSTVFGGEVDWDSLFHNVRELDILYSYGMTWFNFNRGRLNEAIKRHIKVRVVLVDPDDDNTIAILARRYNQEAEQVKAKIKESVEYLTKLRDKGAKISIWLLPAVPLYSFYRFDHTILISLYSHLPEEQSGKGPVFLLDEKGILSKFVLEEFDRMVRPNNTFSKPVI